MPAGCDCNGRDAFPSFLPPSFHFFSSFLPPSLLPSFPPSLLPSLLSFWAERGRVRFVVLSERIGQPEHAPCLAEGLHGKADDRNRVRFLLVVHHRGNEQLGIGTKQLCLLQNETYRTSAVRFISCMDWSAAYRLPVVASRKVYGVPAVSLPAQCAGSGGRRYFLDFSMIARTCSSVSDAGSVSFGIR